jgi:hypothetical protein
VKVLTLVAVWGWSLVWSIPPFLGWSSYTYEPFGTSCSVKWDGVSISDNTYNFCLIIFEYRECLVRGRGGERGGVWYSGVLGRGGRVGIRNVR